MARKKIGEHAFEGCDHLIIKEVDEINKEVIEIENGVTKIEVGAFKDLPC